MAEKNPDRVAIVGRPNVGKSSLFNLLVGRRLAIVEDKPGVTRDRLESEIVLDEDHAVILMDTGGIGLDSEDVEKFDLNKPIEQAFEAADVFVFICDIRAGVLDKDEAVARRLRALGKPVILMVNKADTSVLSEEVHEFWSLGVGEPIPCSVNEKWGIGDLVSRLMEHTRPVQPTETIDLPRVALLGKRNSGKSTLLNFLCRDSRVIVSDIPGTTRDFVETRIEAYGRRFVAVDTAGIKRPNWEDSVDFFSIKRTEKMVRECNAALLMIDATEKVTGVDKALAAMLRDQAKPVVVAINKWDLAPADLKTGEFMEYLDQALQGIAYAPVAFVSALRGDQVRQLVATMFDVLDQGLQRLSTGELNRILEDAVSKKSPPSRGGRQAKFLFASQVDVTPPTFVFKVNDGRLITKSYRRYLENRLREELKAPEIPLRLVFKGRDLDPDAVSRK